MDGEDLSIKMEMSTKASGVTTRHKASESTFITMASSMRVNGLMISSTA